MCLLATLEEDYSVVILVENKLFPPALEIMFSHISNPHYHSGWITNEYNSGADHML